MAFIKHSEGKIINIVVGGEKIDDKKAKKALKAIKQAVKNIDEDDNNSFEDGNNSPLNTESD